MGDRAAATLEVFGVAGHEAELAQIFAGWHDEDELGGALLAACGKPWLDAFEEKRAAASGERFVLDATRLGEAIERLFPGGEAFRLTDEAALDVAQLHPARCRGALDWGDPRAGGAVGRGRRAGWRGGHGLCPAGEEGRQRGGGSAGLPHRRGVRSRLGRNGLARLPRCRACRGDLCLVRRGGERPLGRGAQVVGASGSRHKYEDVGTVP